jgi:HD superfamily phosphohydrolase
MSRIDTTQRIRDPIHGLIEFGSDDEQLVWRLIQTAEFQRLRRVRQLGFSEFVFPGATHSRFAHSVGVFHMAQRLLRIVAERLDHRNGKRARVALCAALLHDLGHGPFSHAFENVLKSLRRRKKHENWTAEIVTGDTQIARVLASADQDLPQDVAKLIAAKEPVDLYASVVSSQFDADRLDYLRRDRYMTGVKIGDFDIDWILDCIEVGEAIIDEVAEKDISPAALGIDQNSIGLPPAGGPTTVQTFVLNRKAREAAEGYLEARYQMYRTVYYHKTTRSAEVVLQVFLGRLAHLIQTSGPGSLGLPENDPVVRFFSVEKPTLAQYLALDDMVIWSLLSRATDLATDPLMKDLANRLMTRRLYKALVYDNRNPGSDWTWKFEARLKEKAAEFGLEFGVSIVTDRPRLTGYDWVDFGDSGSLKKVLIRGEQNENIDLGQDSEIVQALKKKDFYRVYVPGPTEAEMIKTLE